jgi:AcrR family transcriptional regulator
VSPRRTDPQTGALLVDIAARLLAQEGPKALSTRRVAAEAGTSTMAVYTHFGGMDELVRAMVHEGFARLHGLMSRVRVTDDTVADVLTLGRAYRLNAITNPHLYVVMLGGSSLGGFALTDEDRQHGRYTLAILIDAVDRAIRAGRFREAPPDLVGTQLWSALHGLVTLELGGYLIEPFDPEVCFEAQLRDLMVGAGDELARAEEAVRLSRRRATEEVLAFTRPGVAAG